ncbi:chloride channel protein [Paenibacillus sp. MWE-103]|uniref:Chloride channel protein n=1 Tax=Paenibacillus artemisiicola TaxID=1172618 RepID=A0ABS3WBN6_9BACL|nr:chloride channel protein [Paenibacillus artemisiicola]MBO7745741.1 chloride channel protein [Paenibacillus artemisiicola]
MRSRVMGRFARLEAESFLLLLVAAGIGIGGGFGAVGFRKVVELAGYLFYGRSADEISQYVYGIRTLIMPALGGLLTGLLIYLFAREAKGHGVPEVMVAVTDKGGVIRKRIVLVKALASALTIGSGGSVGREGPIVHIGSAWGSAFGQWLGISKRRLPLLVACGAAAGISGTFNAPIGGALFAFEIILGSFALTYIGPIVVSSVVSAAIGRVFLGNLPTFPVPHDEMQGSMGMIALFALLGLAGGLLSLVYIRSLLLFERRWEAVRTLPEWTKPAIGGLAVGVIGFFYPQLLGVGYPAVELTLTGHATLHLVVVLLALKLFATTTTIASGGSGGVFAPGLFMGAMMGSAFGILANLLLPLPDVNPGIFAIVGMAAVFAGTAHAPITAMVMLFELTGDYRLILPLMLVAILSSSVTTKLFRESIYTAKAAKRGIDLIRKRAADKLSAILVTEAMDVEPVMIASNTTIEVAIGLFMGRRGQIAIVKDDQGNWLGFVNKIRMLEEVSLGNGDVRVQTVMECVMPWIEGTATLGEASVRLCAEQSDSLIVKNERLEPLGLISALDIVRAYRLP